MYDMNESSFIHLSLRKTDERSLFMLYNALVGIIFYKIFIALLLIYILEWPQK